MPWDPDVICRGRRYSCKSLLFFDAWFWRYLSWPDTLVEVIACLRCLILMLFVVAGGTFASHCLLSMLHLCRYLWCSKRICCFIVCLRCLILTLYVVARCTSEGQCVPSEVDFERYLSWPDIVCFFMFFFRSRLWMLFVVDPCTFGVHCLLSEVGFCYCFTFRRGHAFLPKLTLNAICCVWSYLWRYNL